MTQAPSLSMLWEGVDPRDALRKRFGFADRGTLASWVGDVLSHHWGIHVQSCDRVVISAWNALAWVTTDQRQLILKLSSMPRLFSRLADIARLTTWLDGHEIPVAAPVPTTRGSLNIELANPAVGRARAFLATPGSRFSVAVMPVVDGDLLNVDDPAQVIDAGRMLASLHATLASYPGRVGGAPSDDSHQLVHNDFRSANILHNGTGITAVLDLEEVTYSTPVADLAKAAVLLGTRYRDWRPTRDDVRDAFIGTYCEQTPLTAAQHHELRRHISEVCDRGRSRGWFRD